MFDQHDARPNAPARHAAGRRAFVAVAAALALVVLAVGADAKSTGRPRRRPVDAVIVHSLGGPDCQQGARFFRRIDGDAQVWATTFARLPIVSIHYVVGRNGMVAPGIPEAVAASHAVGWNQRSIGIELVNNGDGVDPFPAAQLAALRQLVAEIRARHPAVTPGRVLRHSDVDRTTFPAARHGAACTAFRRKLDPGEAFPWDAFKAALSPG
jgi:N-acetylmuramoyl-L-alanine amidase